MILILLIIALLIAIIFTRSLAIILLLPFIGWEGALIVGAVVFVIAFLIGWLFWRLFKV